MNLYFDRGTGVPAYLQLVHQVREAIQLSRLQAGDRLPTVRDAVATSGLNPNTVLKAYRELAMAGLVETRAGAGTFVTAEGVGVDPAVVTRFRARLAAWRRAAHEAGLRDEDIQAIVKTEMVYRDKFEGEGA